MKSLRMLCRTGIGIALYAVLSLCLQVPVFENYYLSLGYVVMMVYCFCIGTASGTLVGVLGGLLYCLLINGLRGMPGWAAGNLFIGLAMGLAFRVTAGCTRRGLRLFLWAAAAVVSATVAMLVIKSLVECLLYAQPYWLRFGKNTAAFVADAFVMVFSLPLCLFLDKTAGKHRRSAGNDQA